MTQTDGDFAHRVGGRWWLGPLLMALFSIAYLGATCHLAGRKPFWTDELLVVSAARSQSLGQLWRSLKEYPDAMPMGIYLAGHLVSRTVGINELTGRLPSIIGFWVMCVCLYLFVRRRLGPLVAAVAMILPVSTGVYDYAYEMRGYGMMLGLCAAALLCWDARAQGRAGVLPLLGLTLFLAGAEVCHLFACVFYVALGLAELWRSWARRRIDWGVWISFAAAVAIAAVVLSHQISNIRHVATICRGDPVLLNLTEMIGGVMPASLVLLCMLAVAAWARRRPATEPDAPGSRPTDWALIGFVSAIPIYAFIITGLTNGLLLLRYILPGTIGLCLAAAMFAGAAIGGRPRMAQWLLVLVAASASVSVLERKSRLFEIQDLRAGVGQYSFMKVADQFPDDGLPILVSDFHTFMQLAYYAPPPVAGRLAYTPNHLDWIDQQTETMSQHLGLAIVHAPDFAAAHKTYYLHDPFMKKELVAMLERGAVLQANGFEMRQPVDIRARLGGTVLATRREGGQ